jgi:hypothetical protein
MRMRALVLGMLALSVAAGCNQAPKQSEETAELAPELKALVLSEAPSDIPHPHYIDFNGKAELLGYALEPSSGLAAPGSKLSLKLYWRSVGKLDEGYVPFTELVTPGGKRIEISGSGPVRQGALVPSKWEPGKVYVDELDITVPADIDAARVSIVVGLKTEPIAPPEPEAPEGGEKPAEKPAKEAGTFGTVYLTVLSGPADDKHGGVVTSLETGVSPATLRARAQKDDKKGVKRPGTKTVSAKPRPAPSAK